MGKLEGVPGWEGGLAPPNPEADPQPTQQQLPAQAGLGVRHAVWLLIGLAQFLGALGALSLPALAPAMMEEVGRTAPSDRAILPCCYIAACARPLSLPPPPGHLPSAGDRLTGARAQGGAVPGAAVLMVEPL